MRTAVFFLSLFLPAIVGAYVVPANAANDPQNSKDAAIRIAAVPNLYSATQDKTVSLNCALSPCQLVISREISLTGSAAQGDGGVIGEWSGSDVLTKGDISYRPRGMLLMRWTLTF